eukprot:scaffold19983_cov26-Tisochrysis_lutea.AAC.1
MVAAHAKGCRGLACCGLGESRALGNDWPAPTRPMGPCSNSRRAGTYAVLLDSRASSSTFKRSQRRTIATSGSDSTCHPSLLSLISARPLTASAPNSRSSAECSSTPPPPLPCVAVATTLASERSLARLSAGGRINAQ